MRRRLLLVLLIASGCASGRKDNERPSPVPSVALVVVEQRLDAFSRAWAAGDAAGVRESFHAADAGEAELVDALGRLAAAQHALDREYNTGLGPLRPIFGGTLDHAALAPGARPWHRYASEAAHPQRVWVQGGRIAAELTASGGVLWLRHVGGDWKLDAGQFADDRPLADVTASVNRQVSRTDELRAALRPRDRAKIQAYFRRIHAESVREIDPALDGAVDDAVRRLILGPRPATTPSTSRPAAAP